jgi:hypothetical protein
MEPIQILALLCFYGPTPLAGLLAGFQALQCSSPWQSLLVGVLGTIALAVVFGVAADYLPVWEGGVSPGKVWEFHLKLSPFVGVPLGIFCAFMVNRHITPPPGDMP